MKHNKNNSSNVPNLRFPEFTGEWKVYKLKNVLTRYINKVDVISNEEYYQIGIRSHGKGIFYKDKVTGEELGNKKIFWLKDNLFIVNIVFAWEQAVAKTTKNEIGWVASHRFPMYESLNGKIDIDFITYYFKTKKGKYLLELASPGGAGRNKTLGQTEFENLDLTLPQQAEQERISSLLSLIDERIVTQNKIIEDLKLLKSAISNALSNYKSSYKSQMKTIAKIGRGRVISNIEINAQSNPKYPVYSSQTTNNGVMGYLDSYDYQGEYLTWTTDGANAGTVFYRNGKFNCTNVCGVLKINSKHNAYYVGLCLQKAAQKYVSSNLANPKLMNNIMAEIEIFLPEIEIQNIVANTVKSIEDNLLTEIYIVEKYQMQKHFLLKNLFI